MSLNKFTDATKGYDLDLGVGADEMKANQIETKNIDLVTINSKPYPPNAPPEGSVFSLQQIGAYNPLPVTSTNATEFILFPGQAPNVNTDIKTINVAPYDGYRIRIRVTQQGALGGTITIKHNDPSQNASEQMYPIICTSFTDLLLNPVSPTIYVWAELIYVENYPNVPEGRAWICSGRQT
jgi:hypothetical protein